MAANCDPATTIPAVPGVPWVPATPIVPGLPVSVPPWVTIIVPRRHG